MPEKREELQDLEQARGSARTRICQRYVEQALQEVRQGSDAAPASELLGHLAETYDHLLRALFRSAEIGSATMVSLVALGGYGRKELFPHSDLDLLVLHDGTAEAAAGRVVEQLVYPLWDARLTVGHAVRSIDETLDLALEDLTARTSLLDARLLCGDEGPFHALEAGGLRRFFGPQRVQEFVVALHEERARRHRRFGETEYLLEPNVKQAKGGLRDLNTALWAAKARFGATRLDQLAQLGAGTQRQLRGLQEAQQFLQRLRLAMHLHSGRSQDHLSFELQEALAPGLFPEVDVPGVKRLSSAVAPAVERLMHAFYRHAHTVVLETGGVLERCRLAGREEAIQGRPVSDAADEHFVLAGRRIHSVRPERFWEQPAEIVRAFQLTLEHETSLDRATRDVIAEAVADVPGSGLMADEEAARLWVEILASPERAAGGTVLEEMHHLGVVSAMVPEFEPCTGRIQHDLYHVYTVDLHSLYVVALLKAWRRGEQAEGHPTAVELMRRLTRLESLMLAGLLHDVAKPLGHGHAGKGARIARGVAARLGLAAPQMEEVFFLVEQHLLMAHLSQRRDLSDPAVIGSFATQVGSVDRLRRLYLLTCADTAMTAPGNLTEWKARLLDELYIKTYLFLTHEREQLDLQNERLLVDRRAQLELALDRMWGESGAALVRRVPRELLMLGQVEDLTHYLTVAMQLDGAVVRVATRARSGGATLECGVEHARGRAQGETSEVTVCCTDSPGRLAAITGVMLMHRIEVLAAQVFTLVEAEPAECDSGGGAGQPARLVLDVFTVQPPMETPDLWPQFTHDLTRALQGELALAEEVLGRTRPSTLKRKVVPRVAIEVTVDNQASDRYTVVEVQSPDWLGVLHAITRTLSRAGLQIHLSKVISEAGRVVDIFYVSDGDAGGKVLDQLALDRWRGEIAAAIVMLDPCRGGTGRNA